MKIINALIISVLAIMIGCSMSFSQEFKPSLEIHIPFTPCTIVTGGKIKVYYEIHFTNVTSDTMILEKLEVSDSLNNLVVAEFAGDELNKRVSLSPKAGENKLAPGSSGIVYLEFVLGDSQIHVALVNRFDFILLTNNNGKRGSVLGANTNFSTKPTIVVGPPLRGGPWAAVYDPSWERGHRRVIYTVNENAAIPGRFAIDFIMLDKKGLYAKEKTDLIENWYGYGMDVLAVADGVVASTIDTFTESKTIAAHPPYPADKATGNYVSVNIGNQHFVFYEHLKPGSIKVRAGQQVKKGDVIASLGFTGQSTGPHLHFHIANKNSALDAEGIPFVFESFIVAGSYPDFEKFGKQPWTPLKGKGTQAVAKEHPSPNSVILFK